MIDLKRLLMELTEPVVAVIALLALVLITLATLRMFFFGLRLMLRGEVSNVDRRAVWLEYGRWLVAGLTIQLAADILESAVYTSWDSIGKLAAVAVIRTFLNYFLERDIEEIRTRQHESMTRAAVPAPHER